MAVVELYKKLSGEGSHAVAPSKPTQFVSIRLPDGWPPTIDIAGTLTERERGVKTILTPAKRTKAKGGDPIRRNGQSEAKWARKRQIRTMKP